MNWIPITQKLPPLNERGESTRVLVVVLVRPGERQQMIATYEIGQWIIEDDQNWPDECVTHWQPLPGLPEQ